MSVYYITKEAKTLVDDGAQFPAQFQDGLSFDGIMCSNSEKVNMAVSTNMQPIFLDFIRCVFYDFLQKGLSVSVTAIYCLTQLPVSLFLCHKY